MKLVSGVRFQLLQIRVPDTCHLNAEYYLSRIRR